MPADATWRFRAAHAPTGADDDWRRGFGRGVIGRYQVAGVEECLQDLQTAHDDGFERVAHHRTEPCRLGFFLNLGSQGVVVYRIARQWADVVGPSVACQSVKGVGVLDMMFVEMLLEGRKRYVQALAGAQDPARNGVFVGVVERDEQVVSLHVGELEGGDGAGEHPCRLDPPLDLGQKGGQRIA